MSAVSIRNVVKSYGDVQVIHSLSLDIERGEFMVFVGPSGCGKSTLLRMIAGLESFQSGDIAIGDRVVNTLPARDRDIAMVFQEYALYPHMSVEGNMGFGLKMRDVPKAEVAQRVRAAAATLQIEHLLGRRPRELSGGQRQRVAMGRAIVRAPQVFLFDEPLSNLDAKLRVDMRVEIKRLHQRLRATMIYVTHDQVEAMTMADRIVVLNGGRIEQVGAPKELYRNPQSQFVASFIGSPTMNFLRAAPGPEFVTLESGAATPVRSVGLLGKPLLLGIRPEHLRLQAHGLEATVEVVEPLGADTLVTCRVGSELLVARTPGDTEVMPGAAVKLGFDAADAVLFDAESGQRQLTP